MLNEIRNSHKLLQSKRRKLRTGAITFAFKRFYYGEFLISQWFEMEFKAQVNSNDSDDIFKETLKTLNLVWDFQTALLLIIVLLLIINYLTVIIQDSYYNLITSSWSLEVRRFGLRYVFDSLISYRSPNLLSIQLTDLFVDTALICELF